MMPVLAFFWDIENCPVPSSKCAVSVVQKLREKFVNDAAEVDFVVVCDVMKERQEIVDELNSAQITLVHINSLAKNSCDDKLRILMSKFSMLYHPPGTVVLISSDVNFTHSLTDLRYRCGFHTILIHNEQVSNALLQVANEHYNWQWDVLSSIASHQISAHKPTSGRWHRISVSGLPIVEQHKVRDRLKQLSDNCGGKVLTFDVNTKTAVLGFTNFESAQRARKRVDGADAFGKRISVTMHTESMPFTTSMAAVACGPATGSFLPCNYVGRTEIAHCERGLTEDEPVDDCALDEEGAEEQRSSGEEVNCDTTMWNEVGNDTTMESIRGHFEESEKLKRVLGVVKRRAENVSPTFGIDGMDTSPKESQEYRTGSSVAMPELGEKHPHSPSTKLRVLERFAREAAELLRSSRQCRVQLSRFASSWCKHFNRPLRLSDFGCSRLTDLLDDASDTLQVVTGSNREKWVTLAPALLRSSLQDQIVSVLRQQPFRRAPVDNLMQYYQMNFGYALDLRLFGFNSIEEVLNSMQGIIEVEKTDNNILVVNLVDFRHRQILANQLLYMFIRCPERRLDSWQLENEFRAEFGVDLSIDDVKNYLTDLVSITEYDGDIIFIELHPVQRLALRLRRILVANGGEMPLTDLEQLYGKHYGERIEIAGTDGGTKSVLGVLRMASHILYLKGRGLTSCTVCINRNFLSSLKGLKPDLFIPPEANKGARRKHSGSVARSLPFSSGNGFDRLEKGCSHRRMNVPVRESGHRVPTKSIPVPKRGSPTTPIMTGKQATLYDYGISATSSPVESYFERAGANRLDPDGQFGISVPVKSPSQCSSEQASGSGSPQAQLDRDTPEDTATASRITPPIKARRSRLAANFDALAKLS